MSIKTIISNIEREIEDSIDVSPSTFSDLTLKEIQELKLEVADLKRAKKTESRKNQILERIVKTKNRKLLVV